MLFYLSWCANSELEMFERCICLCCVVSVLLTPIDLRTCLVVVGFLRAFVPLVISFNIYYTLKLINLNIEVAIFVFKYD